jgi:outer membrane protein OmpA-like peptidoglycan-associated protein
MAFAYAFAGSGDDKSLVRKGDRAFRKANIADALMYYQKALTVNPKDCYANFQEGALLYLTDSARIKSITYFQNSIKFAPAIGEDTIIDAYYYLGNCYILKKQYDSAIYAFQKYLVHLVDDKYDAPLLKEVKHNIDLCRFAPELIQRSPDSASYIINGKYQPTYVKNLGSLINTPYPEYAEVVLDHDSLMVFTSRRPTSQGGRREYPTGSYYEDMFMSHKDNNGRWTPPSLFSSQLLIKASRLNLASVCISADNKTLFVFHKGMIYESHRSGATWSEPKRVQAKIKNIKAYMPSVFLSYDGKQLFLVTDKKGGYGGRDIYVSKLDDKGIWGTPSNLGPDINTSFDEDAPFLMPDNKTLFFSSKGHNGLGGYDIFKSVYENGKWSTPVNVGAPINSPADDIFFEYDTATKKGYFSSARINEGYGDMDLYTLSFTCDNIENTMLQGKVIAEGNKTISSPTVMYTDLKTGQNTIAAYDESGKYSIQLKPDTKYSVSVRTLGYLPINTSVTTPHQCDAYNLYQIINLNYIMADSMKKGQNVAIKNAFYHVSQAGIKNVKDDQTLSDLAGSFNDKNDIWYSDSAFAVNYTQAQIDSINPHAKVVAVTNPTKVTPTAKNSTVLFELNSSVIASSTYSSLDSLAKIMRTNTKIKLQVYGYADNTGKEDHNQSLSDQRAKAVVQYLIKKGVKSANIHAEGKGSANPVAQNDGTHNYLNRRAELMVIQ